MTQISTTAVTTGPRFIRKQRPLVRSGKKLGADAVLWILTHAAAITVILMVVALVGVLAYAAMPSIKTFGARFLISSDWRPNEIPELDAAGHIQIVDGETLMSPPAFGALPVIYGTGVSAIISLLFAVPLSFGAALFLVRIAAKKWIGPVSLLVEFLAAIPSIAYGLWGLFVLAPLLQKNIEPALRSMLEWVPGLGWLFHETVIVNGKTIVRDIPLVGRDMLCGGLVLAIMILPIITAISRDVLRSVPRAQIEGTLALGATWWQSSWEMLRYSKSGLVGAVMLGLARAAGETMAITMVIGNNSQIRASIFAPAQTMSSLLANEFSEASTELHRAALTEVALILLVMSLAFNLLARWLIVGRGSAAKGH